MKRLLAFSLAAGITAVAVAGSRAGAASIPIADDLGTLANETNRSFSETGPGPGMLAAIAEEPAHGTSTGDVQSVPMPAALPLFLTALAGAFLVARKGGKILAQEN